MRIEPSPPPPHPRFVSAGEALTDYIRTGTDSWLSRAGGSDWLLHAQWDVHLRFAVATGTAACLEAGAVPPTLASVQKLLTRM